MGKGKHVCTECGEEYQGGDTGSFGDLTTSHGICPECAEEWEAALVAEMRSYDENLGTGYEKRYSGDSSDPT